MSMFKTLSSSPRFTRQLFAVALASALLGASALAQTRRAAETPAATSGPTSGATSGATNDAISSTLQRDGGHTVTYKQRTNYDFDDDQVEGTLVQPDTDLITGRGKATHESLVRPRTTFQPEMLKSVESL